MSIKEKTVERFLRYVQIPTASDENSDMTPSTPCQFDLARVLVEDMLAMGIEDAHVDEKCYVYGSIPAAPGLEKCPAIGFIAHVDTVADFTAHKVNPIVHENYDGKDLSLGDSGRILKNSDFDHLPSLTGRTLITSDGTTLLGADDKAGVVEILTMADEILSGDLPHGRICISFTPDEEIGAGAKDLDLKKFGADFAYTIDGGKEGLVEYENFNAASARFDIAGVGVHPGDAKDIMVNAALLIMEINGMLPEKETPARTEGYEGFYHLTSVEGGVEKAQASYIVRDHDRGCYLKRLDTLRAIEEAMNQKYGEGTVQLTVKEQYRNMKEKIEPHFHLIENAKTAIKKTGILPEIIPIRGGTDGSQLSFRGLPCPNLGTGGYAFHGPYEHITAEGMEAVVNILLGIVEEYASF